MHEMMTMAATMKCFEASVDNACTNYLEYVYCCLSLSPLHLQIIHQALLLPPGSLGGGILQRLPGA